MKISYNWLKELIPGLTASPDEVAELLTMHSFETEVANSLSIDPVIKVVKITKIEPHPKADRLRLATVTDGQEEVTVVCGAQNITEGDVVPYSPPGARLVGEDGKEFKVVKTAIRGIESPGMLNSLRELGLHDDHSDIWLLPDDIPIGSSLADHVPDDTILEADVTPNRAHDCLSHIGIAREVAALLDLNIHEPELPELPQPETHVDGWVVEVKDARLCPRYIGVVLNNLTSAPSPLWLQARLLAAGGKPILNLVDITNYVMFELGNPTHLFDQEIMPGKAVGVRNAQRGEKLVTLDEVEHTLSVDDIVITADDRPVALAGVMGGQKTEISTSTTNAFLEVANFNAYSIQETARNLNAKTESSDRFSKGVDPNLVHLAAQRAVGLFQELAGGSVTGVIDTNPTPRSGLVVKFNPQRVSAVVGTDIISEQQSKMALGKLRMKVDSSVTPWKVSVPTDRLDLQAEHDLVEEVIRLVGFDSIESAAIQETQPQPLPHSVYWREVVRDTLVELGLTETYNYSFEPAEYAGIAGVGDQNHLSLTNPPAPEYANMRVSLLPGLFAHLSKNRDAFQRNAGVKESSLFEIGAVYRPSLDSARSSTDVQSDKDKESGGRVPGVEEEVHVAGVVVGSMPSVDTIRHAVATKLDVEPTSLESFGSFGELTGDSQKQLKYKLPVAYFELNLSELTTHAPQAPHRIRTLKELQREKSGVKRYVPFSRFPSVYRDISMLVDPSVSVEQVQELIERVGGELVVETDLFDEYQPAGDARRGLAFHIEYRSMDHTLTDREVDVIHQEIAETLEHDLSAQVR